MLRNQACFFNAEAFVKKKPSPGKIKVVTIPPPTPAEQRVVVRHLNSIGVETRRLKALYPRKLAALDELKAALLHQAFSGQL
jgi:type I restriction enzyme S subunit